MLHDALPSVDAGAVGRHAHLEERLRLILRLRRADVRAGIEPRHLLELVDQQATTAHECSIEGQHLVVGGDALFGRIKTHLKVACHPTICLGELRVGHDHRSELIDREREDG